MTEQPIQLENEFVRIRHSGTRIVKRHHPSIGEWVKYTTRFISDGSFACFKNLIDKKKANADRR
jgi:hypothetical protein